MGFRTWSSRGGRRARRHAVVGGLVVVSVLALATAALAWFPVNGPRWTRGAGVDRPSEPRASADDGDVEPGRTASLADPVWHCPVEGGRAVFRDDYGYRKPSGRVHRGVDLYAVLGTPIVAPEAGRVERSESPTAGKQVTLHTDDRRYLLLHLSRFESTGQVEAGATIGYVGTSGNARGATPHLHFEIREAGGPIDPYPELDEHCR